MTAASLYLTALEQVPTIRAGDDLAAVAVRSATASMIDLKDGDILVFAQKIVSKSEGRFVRLGEVEPSLRARDLAHVCEKDPRLVELVLRESVEVLRCRPGVLIVVHRNGMVMANAGIDASNVEGGEGILLLPEDSDASARRLSVDLGRLTGARIGVIVNDSFGRAWRLGTVGTAIGLAGLPGLIDLRGRPDRSGRVLQTTEVGAADEMAAAASLLMGQADEGRPIVHARGFPYERRDGRAAELLRPSAMDLFR